MFVDILNKSLLNSDFMNQKNEMCLFRNECCCSTLGS